MLVVSQGHHNAKPCYCRRESFPEFEHTYYRSVIPKFTMTLLWVRPIVAEFGHVITSDPKVHGDTSSGQTILCL